MLHGREPSGAEGGFAVATDSSSLSSSSSCLADVDETMSTSSRKSPSMWKERDCWSAELEGEMEKLDPWIPKGGPLVSSNGAYKRRR